MACASCFPLLSLGEEAHVTGGAGDWRRRLEEVPARGDAGGGWQRNKCPHMADESRRALFTS